jgi:hypothetical protein
MISSDSENESESEDDVMGIALFNFCAQADAILTLSMRSS